MLDPRIRAYCQEDITDIGGFERSELVEVEEGRFVMKAYPGPDCGNNIGTVHGGFLLALADTAGTGAVDTLGCENATMSLSSNFLRPAFTTDGSPHGRLISTSATTARLPCFKTVPTTSRYSSMKATVTSAVFDSRIVDLPRLAEA